MIFQSFENHGARWACCQTSCTPNGATKNYSWGVSGKKVQFTPTVLFTTHHSKCLMCCYSLIHEVAVGISQAFLNPCNSSVRQVPFCSYWDPVMESVSGLPKVTQLVSSGPGIWRHTLWPQLSSWTWCITSPLVRKERARKTPTFRFLSLGTDVGHSELRMTKSINKNPCWKFRGFRKWIGSD